MERPRLPDLSGMTDLRRYDRAEWFQERIEIQIEQFRKELQPDEDVAVNVLLNNGTSVAATWFGYHNPNMLVIDGIDGDGKEVRVLAPHANIQLVLIPVPKDKPKRQRIGFQPRSESNEGTQTA